MLLTDLLDDSSTALDLAGCIGITDTAVEAALARLPHLQALDVSACDRLTSRTLRAAAQLCPQLRTLRLGGTPASDKVAAVALEALLPRIEQPSTAEERCWDDVAGESGSGACWSYLVPYIQPNALYSSLSSFFPVLFSPL